MKVYDIISEDTEVAEAPVSRTKQFAKKLGAKGLAKVGAKGVAKGMAAEVDVGTEANRLKSELKTWMKGSRIKAKQLDYEDLMNFLEKAGFDRTTVQKVIKKYKADAMNPDIKTGTTATSDKGEEYKWEGAQWVSDETGKVAKRTVAQELNQKMAISTNPKVVDKIIRDIVTAGYKKQGGGSQTKSKYATGGSAGKKSAAKGKKQDKEELKKAADMLKKAGFTVSQ